LQGKLDGEVKHRYQTVDELRRALKERGLPVPPKMIELNPKEFSRVANDDEAEAA
jgi:hypothetical protein